MLVFRLLRAATIVDRVPRKHNCKPRIQAIPSRQVLQLVFVMNTHANAPLETMLNTIRKNRSLTVSLFLFITLGAIFFPSAGRDDDHIAYWSAKSLLELGEIVSYSGDRLEQGSSLGFVALMTIASGISGLRVPDIAIPIAVTSGLLLLFLLNKFKLFFDRRVVNYALLIAATSFPFTYWSFSGLETSTYTFALTLFCFIFLKFTQKPVGVRQYLYLFPAVLAMQLLRPEAFFVLGLSIGLFWLIRSAREIQDDSNNTPLIQAVLQSESTKFSAFLILINFAAITPVVLFRYIYFGSIIPQPVLSKVSGIFPGLHSGIPLIPSSKYIIDFFIHNPILIGAIIVLLGVIYRIATRQSEDKLRSTDILIAFILSQLTFVMLSGPDWMEAFRFIMPVVPIFSLMSAILIHGLFKKNTTLKKPLIALLVCIQATGFGIFVINDSSSIPLWATRNNVIEAIAGAQNYSWFSRANTHHLRDIPVVEALNDTIKKLRPLVKNRPIVITSYQAGFVMYHVAKENYGDIQFIDLVGLADDTITTCPPLKSETRRLRDAEARINKLGHLQVLRYLISESGKAGSCFSQRPDIIYLMGETKEIAPELKELGYVFAFNNTGNISLDFGKSEFYGGYLVDQDLFAAADLKFVQSQISVVYR